MGRLGDTPFFVLAHRVVTQERGTYPAPRPAKFARRAFASVLYAIGETPPVVMAEMGHTDPKLALKIYAHAMRRD